MKLRVPVATLLASVAVIGCSGGDPAPATTSDANAAATVQQAPAVDPAKASARDAAAEGSVQAPTGR